MFGLTSGEKKFKNCVVKRVQFTERGGVGGPFYGAVLHCPGTDPEYPVESSSRKHEFRFTAEQSLCANAGRLACRICPLAGMSEVEAYEYAAVRDEAKARALQMATELRLAQMAADQANLAVEAFLQPPPGEIPNT